MISFIALATYLSLGLTCCALFHGEILEEIEEGERTHKAWLWFIPAQLLLGPVITGIGFILYYRAWIDGEKN